MSSSKSKSITVAYFLLAVLGFQGFHQFYLGNFKRGLSLAALIHIPMFAFAYMVDHSGGDPNRVGDVFGLAPLLAVLLGLLAGCFLFLTDVITLQRQLHARSQNSPRE